MLNISTKRKEMKNPNSAKFFDKRYGMTYNNKCPRCKIPTWSQESTHTCYNGKHYTTNVGNKTVGVLYDKTLGEMNGDEVIHKSGIYCEVCYTNHIKEER